jgi:putative aldouronate transport system substrate-binding protein
MVNDALNAYIGPKINAKVNIHYLTSADHRTRINAMLSSGQDFGIVATLNYFVNSQRGTYYPIEKLLDQYGSKTKSLFSQTIWDAMKVNGHIYGIPSLKDNSYIMSLIYNEDLARKLGVDMTRVPYTAGGWYKLEPWLNEVKAKRDQIMGANIEEPLIWAYGYGLTAFHFAVDSFLGDNALAVANIQGINDIAGYDPKTIFNLFATREYRDFAHAQWRMVQKNILAYDYTGKNEWNYTGNMFAWPGWGYAYMPDHLYGDAFTTRMIEPNRVWTDTNNYANVTNCISAASKTPEREMMFLELVNNDPVVATMVRFGIEGTHYVKDTQGNMTTAGTRNANPSSRGYYYWYGPYAGNLTIVNAPDDLTGPNGIMLTKINQFNREAKMSPYFGFSLNTEPISTEIAACTSVIVEYAKTLNMGQAGSEAEVDRLIDEFNAKLKANGVDRIVAEAQKQADAFLAFR